jgi:hypothetical protein
VHDIPVFHIQDVFVPKPRRAFCLLHAPINFLSCTCATGQVWAGGDPCLSLMGKQLVHIMYTKYIVFNATLSFLFCLFYDKFRRVDAGDNNTEERNHIYKNNKTYKEEPGQVQKTNYIDWTSGNAQE